MRVTTPLENIARGGSRTFVAASRAIEKASASSALNMQSGAHKRGKEKSSPHPRVEPVSQTDTHRFDPFWDGPRLLPVFVAQLLGQVMPERRNSAAIAQSAYGSAPPRTYGAGAPKMGLLVDRKS